MRLVYHERVVQIAILLSAFLCVFTLYSFSGFQVARVCVDCLEVDVLDIGQGDAIYVRTPSGNSMLIDAGPRGGQVNKKISEVNRNIFDTNIDVLLATHPDADHIGGLQEVLQRFSSDLFVDPGVKSDTATYKNLISEIDGKNIKHVVARKGLDIILDRNITFHVLYPSDEFFVYQYDKCLKDRELKKTRKVCKKNPELGTNDMSIVGMLTYGETSFLLTGDAPENVEDYLIHTQKDLNADVLKVGHHGSKYSTTDEFVKAVSPTYAVISVGAKNRYGHPAERVLEALKGVQVLRTDLLGTIRFVSDGKTVEIK